MKRKNLKGQVTLQYILTVAVIAIIVLILFAGVYFFTSKNLPNKVILAMTSFNSSNIYIGNQSLYFEILSSQDLFNATNYSIAEKIEFSNGTKQTIVKNYTLINKENQTDNMIFLQFFSENVINENVNGSALLQLLYLKTNNTIIYPEQNTTEQVIVYSLASYNNLPFYHLSISANPSNGGTVEPPSQYYKSGTTVVLNATPTKGYGFVQWIGNGTGNYSGSIEKIAIVLKGNVTEYAMFNPTYPLNIETSFPGLKMQIGGESIITNVTENLTATIPYSYDFPSSYVSPDGMIYSFVNASLCGNSVSESGTFVMNPDYSGCTLLGNYKVLAPLTINIKNPSLVSDTYLLLTFQNGSTEQAYSTDDYYVVAGQSVTLQAFNSTTGYFKNYTGNGTVSYTGVSNPTTIKMEGPITENVSFLPETQVLFVSKSPISVLVNDKNEITTNQSYSYPYDKSFSVYSTSNEELPGYDYINWGTRNSITINQSASTCDISGSTITAINSSDSSNLKCTVYINQPVTQYLLQFNDYYYNNESKTFQYGNVYFSNGTQAQNDNWINANTVVSFYGTNNQAGYGFKNFTSYANGTVINGTSVIGYSGNDSDITPAISSSQSQSESCPDNDCSFSTSTGFNSNFEFWGYDGVPISTYYETFISSSIEMTNPAIENSNYIKNNSITENTITVNVDYSYFIQVEEASSSGSTNNGGTQITTISDSYTTVNSGVESINVDVSQPYTNWTTGIGKAEINYFTGGSGYTEDYPPNYYYYDDFSYNLGFSTQPNLNNMPPEFQNIKNDIINQIVSNYNTYVSENPDTVSKSSYEYSFSFSLSGTNIYYDYNGALSGEGTTHTESNYENGNAFGNGFTYTSNCNGGVDFSTWLYC